MNKEVSGERFLLDALNLRYRCLNSRYCCLKESLSLTYLRVYGTREDDEQQSPQTLGQQIIDPQILKKKITAAISVLSFRHQHVLVQFWSPVTVRKRCLLTTLDQPFGIGVVNEALYKYRLESEQRMFAVDREHIEDLSLPGRVYRQKLPEWSLDIQGLPTSQNIKDLTACHDIKGYVSLPVVDPASGCCVGVLEFITLSKHVDYAFEVIEISKALKEQDLKTSNAFKKPRFSQLGKINDILKVMCDTHNLPLAQTWELSPLSSHVLHEKSIHKSCSSFDHRCIGEVCMSAVGLPFYVRDRRMWPFHKACRKQHLKKSRGVVGKALLSHCASYCEDVTNLSAEEYPLVHYARMSGLGGCFAIYLHDVKGKSDYILEFFMPWDFKDSIIYLLNLVEELKLKIDDASGFEMGDMSSIKVIRPPSVVNNISSMTEVDTPNGIIPHPFVTNVATIAYGAYANVSMQKTRDNGNDAGEPSNRLIRNIKRKRDSLTMEAVAKLVGQPMDEACKSLGVSRSTLKRFLRDNGIPRWSMSKLSNRSACVMDSNQHLLKTVFKRSAGVLSRVELPGFITCRSVLEPIKISVKGSSSDLFYSSGDLSFSTTVGARGRFLSKLTIHVYHVAKLIMRLKRWKKRSFVRIAMAHQDTNTEQATNNVDPLMARTAMAHQNDPVVFDSTTYMEQATNNVDPLMPRTAMLHQNDRVVFNNTTYMEQATDNVHPLMDVDVTDLNFVDAFPMLSGADFIDDRGSFLKMAGCSSDSVFGYLMEPDGLENAMTEIGRGLEGAWLSPIGSADMFLYGSNSFDYDFSNLVFDDQLF